MTRVAWESARGLADYHERHVALDANLGDGLEQVDEALHGNIGAGGGHDASGHGRYFPKWSELV